MGILKLISERKKYLIKIFLKKCTAQNISKEYIEFYFKLCENTYPNVSSEKLEEFKKKFTLEEYTDRLIPVIDEYFSIEDLQGIIKFYSSDMGKKMLDTMFLQKVGEIGNNLVSQIEQEFALNNFPLESEEEK